MKYYYIKHLYQALYGFSKLPDSDSNWFVDLSYYA